MGMSGQRFTMRWGKVGRRIALASVLALIAAYGLIALATPAAAAPLTGGFSPTVINGAADLNGDNEATRRLERLLRRHVDHRRLARLQQLGRRERRRSRRRGDRRQRRLHADRLRR